MTAGRSLTLVAGVLVVLEVLGGPALAQSQTPGGMPPPPGMSLANSAAMRFPQPVRVGDLLNRDVVQPIESQAYVGTVRQIVRYPDGTLAAVIDYGGFLGFGSRLIAVPIDAMVLVGQVLESAAFSQEQLRGLPNFQTGSAAPVSPDVVIKVGLAKPSH